MEKSTKSVLLQHDTVAVYLFQTKLTDFLKTALPFNPKKTFYYSDGAASQYKNRKNFVNLCKHKADFGIEAEWHFSATSHGKGPSGGVGGTVKCLAARAGLQGHSSISQSKDAIRVRPYSFSSAFKEEKVTKQEREFEIEEISGFVTCKYDGQWWLTCVLDTDSDKGRS